MTRATILTDAEVIQAEDTASAEWIEGVLAGLLVFVLPVVLLGVPAVIVRWVS